jgi:ribulose-5-phosphate 4-epimerase/fuculose-1-phosphate aldolase
MSEREDLVLAYRILAAHGVVGAYGHVSLRTAKNPQRYLLARAMAPELVTADDIVEFDLDSNAVTDPGVALYLERYIHGEIFKRRPDINAVVHNHSPSVIPFGVTTVPLRPLFNTGPSSAKASRPSKSVISRRAAISSSRPRISASPWQRRSAPGRRR